MGQAIKQTDGIDRRKLRAEFQSLLEDTVQDMRPLRPRRAAAARSEAPGFVLAARRVQVARAGQGRAAVAR